MCVHKFSWTRPKSKNLCRNHQEKTIEGDLFSAFVAAGAISKANADDPKKSSFVRCARTDKGVHAAGNVISLKLVIEDPEIVTKINEHLSPQIRVWGIGRTNSSFSAYQMCDSRIYEYLIPSYAFLPPHPQSFLGKQILEAAKEEKDIEGYQKRQEEVADFWQSADEKHIKPAIEGMDPPVRAEAQRLYYNSDTAHISPEDWKVPPDKLEAEQHVTTELCSSSPIGALLRKDEGERGPIVTVNEIDESVSSEAVAAAKDSQPNVSSATDLALRALKAAYAAAKRAYRIHPTRLARIRSTLSRFVGSHKYHNYTVDKSFKDASATRTIKSFVVDENPIIIGETEWLFLKVHGQSFMMHQIRKMVSAAAFTVRCGCHEGRIQDTYLSDRLSIPKAPSLGLLLERPVFDAYNQKLEEFGREKIDFGKYDAKIREFKQREIYERIFTDEEKHGIFLSFFMGLDSTRSASLLWASSAGIAATKKTFEKNTAGIEPGALNSIEDVEGEDEHGAQEDN